MGERLKRNVEWLRNPMRKELSSPLTLFYKFFPAFWIPFFGLGTFGLLFGVFQGKDGSPPPDSFKLLFLTLWIGGSIFSYLTCAALKQVSIDERFLYVSNYIKEISIPLDEIVEVTENRWLNIHPVTAHLKRSTVFGNKITFMPTMRFFNWSSHPVVNELKSIAEEQARNSG